MVRRAAESSARRGRIALSWIFGYGSVIWNPGFPYLEKRLVRLPDWSRRFWQGSTDHRGVPGAPGRVVTIVPDPGQECWGMLFRLDEQHWNETVANLDVREQGGYSQEWLVIDDVRCLAYVARPDNPEYLGDGDPRAIALQIATAAGPSGVNHDYLFRLAASLRELNVTDAHVFELERLVTDRLAVQTLRGLALDMPRAADSGHSGTAMSLAPLGWMLYSRVLRHAPTHPSWPNRDRFVLSNGHACVLLYGLLHLCGYGLTLDELRRFRKRDGVRVPGHPETWRTPGVDASTGPLGQGLAMAVGLALGERYRRARGGDVDHFVYALCSDGDLMEGVTSEASSLAGHLRLGKLIAFYDDNSVTIDGPTSQSWSEDVEARYRAYGWQTLAVDDGEDLDALEAAVRVAQTDERPSLIRVHTVIGYPSPGMSGRPEAHSPPFSQAEIRATKTAIGIDPETQFWVSAELQAERARIVARGEAWAQSLSPTAVQAVDWPVFEKPMATRIASGLVLNAIAAARDDFLGGSADLAGSTHTLLTGESDQSFACPHGRNLRYGVREHAMAAITNGLAQYGLVPFCSTYFSFSDYLKPSIRLAALSGLGSVFVFSHDSLALGEDGPTHQPVEQLAGLRALPNCVVLRPADPNETTESWRVALERRHGPTVLVLSRQTLPCLPPSGQVARGAYAVRDCEAPRVVLMASGSEVHLCLAAAERLGVPVRVVSMPSWELFEAGGDFSILGRGPRIAVEAGASLGWHRWVGERGKVIALDRFGDNGPGDELMRDYGFTVEAVVQATLSLLDESWPSSS